MCKYFHVYPLNLYVKHEFLLMFPTLIHYHVAHSGLLPLLICMSPIQQWGTWLPTSAILLLTCLIPVCRYSCIRVVNWYSVGNNVMLTRVQCFCAVPFALVLQKSIHCQSYLGQRHFFTLFSKIISSICNTAVFSCHPLHSFLGSPVLLNVFLFFALHTLRFTLCAVKFYGFWQMNYHTE